MRTKVAALVLVVLCFGVPAFAVSVNELDANFSAMMLGNVSGNGYPNPVLQLWGVGLPIQIAGPFFVEPSLDVFGTFYEWIEQSATPVPSTEDGPADNFYTIAFLVGLHAGLEFPLGKAVTLGGSIGADFLLRFPFDPANTNADSVADRVPAQQYFFASGRFFYPETRLFMRWMVSDAVGLVLNVRAFYPLFHLWDGLNQPFLDEFMFSGGVGVAIRLGRPAPK